MWSLFGANAELADTVGTVLGELGAESRLRGVAQPLLGDHQTPEAKATADATSDDLEWADGIIFTSPSHTGLPSAAIKLFIDEHHEEAVAGAFLNKSFTAMATSAFAHAGQERVVDDLNAVAAAWGLVVVAPSTANAELNKLDGNPYGLSFVLEHGKLADAAATHAVLTAHLRRFIAVTDALVPLHTELVPASAAPLQAKDVFG